MQIRSFPDSKYWTVYGAMNLLATPAQWMYISNGFGISWLLIMRIGLSLPFEALVIASRRNKMRKINTIFSKLFLSYSVIIVVSFLLFIGVFFYLFHINLYREYEETFLHQYEQIERQLQNQERFDWSDSETAEILRYSLNQPDYHIYITDEESRQIFGPDPDQVSQVIGISDDMIQQVTAGERVADG